MKIRNSIRRRKSIRMKGYDYSSKGAYHVTICAQNKECRFGIVENEKLILNKAGIMINECWSEIENLFSNVRLDEFIVMPNHFHGIVFIEYSNNSSLKNSHQNNESFDKVILGDIIGAFKSKTTNEYIQKVYSNEFPPFSKRLWQRNYHDRIIRDENELRNIREYIKNNPKNWKSDDLFESI